MAAAAGLRGGTCAAAATPPRALTPCSSSHSQGSSDSSSGGKSGSDEAESSKNRDGSRKGPAAWVGKAARAMRTAARAARTSLRTSARQGGSSSSGLAGPTDANYGPLDSQQHQQQLQQQEQEREQDAVRAAAVTDPPPHRETAAAPAPAEATAVAAADDNNRQLLRQLLQQSPSQALVALAAATGPPPSATAANRGSSSGGADDPAAAAARSRQACQPPPPPPPRPGELLGHTLGLGSMGVSLLAPLGAQPGAVAAGAAEPTMIPAYLRPECAHFDAARGLVAVPTRELEAVGQLCGLPTAMLEAGAAAAGGGAGGGGAGGGGAGGGALPRAAARGRSLHRVPAADAVQPGCHDKQPQQQQQQQQQGAGGRFPLTVTAWYDLDPRRQDNVLTFYGGAGGAVPYIDHTCGQVANGAVAFRQGFGCGARMAEGALPGWSSRSGSPFTVVWIGRFGADTAAHEQWLLGLGRSKDGYDRELFWSTHELFTYNTTTGFGVKHAFTSWRRPPTGEWTFEAVVRYPGATSAALFRRSQSSKLARWPLFCHPRNVSGEGLSLGADWRDWGNPPHSAKCLSGGAVAVVLVYGRALSGADLQLLSSYYAPRFGLAS
ncbi:hypothetical protein HXX76_013571 [Chlamydomonas incerta]|uniref:Uncharacterized protein n=1 Tax=Chlamydomonas incerta TaxID=51695 RepID=A0A835SDZ5_CHLIN|nr:hypothetical protein HXX76_013571 [Chlamydomonas incerta]|eukprot:KAG2425527.1 hypothetical protein HXX76_013571 [Chlamydomonas incerta]